MLLRSYFRRALERPEEWIDEAEAWVQCHLGKLFESKSKCFKARDFQMKAHITKDKLWEAHAGYIPEGVSLDDDAAYDHMVPIESGRSTITKRMPGQNPEMVQNMSYVERQAWRCSTKRSGDNPKRACLTFAIWRGLSKGNVIVAAVVSAGRLLQFWFFREFLFICYCLSMFLILFWIQRNVISLLSTY